MITIIISFSLLFLLVMFLVRTAIAGTMSPYRFIALSLFTIALAISVAAMM